MKNSPARVLAAIDQYGREKAFLMNVGHEKGRIVTDIIAQRKPSIMIELGGYVGYSTILFADAVRKAGGKKYLSLELSPTFATVSKALVQLAGLDDIVEYMIGPCRDSLRALRSTRSGALDLIFLDHAKFAYTNDLKLCEELALVGQGTTLVADNVICPGNPKYLEYLRSPPAKKIEEAKTVEAEKSVDVSIGNPRLIYDTSLVYGLAPTGEQIGWSGNLALFRGVDGQSIGQEESIHSF
ncbi:hypothetical protein ASPWEDRAFT_37814 [Aspergillus wentii DTO 134E9]|uniref:catechol O-methyltransferase n=1 Tax=Aspergillus wentii DTO 134E9 TaxID=1073089 RepID=A0A1L9RYF4_ASPWE|nr:uncharacterized protein ASPWEDRAFT_37814 [Aspergillus wentii DTO 134E9]OJJ39942.1 hypothetical protein ASPWEDRAFT_37814 [Aspergillus wentii DTO 134E9]